MNSKNKLRNIPNKKQISDKDLILLKELEKKVSWLSSWMIHNANNLRISEDGLKVGGHQASSASIVSIMVALYFKILQSEDRVAVKPHAAPVFHSIQYLLGNQTQDKLKNFRGFGGAQSYPSRTKDTDDVDYSTGSVGLGGAITIFGSLIQDYLYQHNFIKKQKSGKMVALLGDAELDEGNIYEALLEGAKQNVRNCWWIIDYNRQSLDAVVADELHLKIDELFASMGWRVVTLKYGKKLQSLSKIKGGNLILNWIDSCPNDLYSALSYLGSKGWREHLNNDLKNHKDALNIINTLSDEELNETMSNLAGNDVEAVLEAFLEADSDDIPTCFIAYTIKGFGLPLAGHKDNHAGLMNIEQMEIFKKELNISKGEEWDFFSGMSAPKNEVNKFLKKSSFYNNNDRNFSDKKIEISKKFKFKESKTSNTQEVFGRIINEIGKEDSELSKRIVTFSPDVTVSTNLGGWVNQKQIYNREKKTDIFHDEKVVSAQKWHVSPEGQHFELGIAENNLFLALGAAGLSKKMFGASLIPIGTIYDTFISRGLDALNYAVYQDARFLLVATPSGISLGPEGGAHQSIITPLIGIGQPNLLMFEPTYADELEVILRYTFSYMQEENGSSVYIRLSTRNIDQINRKLSSSLEQDILSGGYWLEKSKIKSDLIIVFSGVMAPEVLMAAETMKEDEINISILSVTSNDRLYKNWKQSHKDKSRGINNKSRIEKIFENTSKESVIITINDAHSSTLTWIGGAVGRKVISLGVDEFGQSGNLKDLYNYYALDQEAIVDACAQIIVDNN
ncbi:MAG: Pyruvate dehydrogenase E1 component [Alphaproteobacteria bacterium MarineAlpha9_Bin3]|nr:MAG: Pyruvate dehydrogenase E1 component [Alphaproteobacteria bacterium MarineAlpha9_Bin3]|tara:strand:- start:1319 stop:3691 length:2373 start_codon:yes stop_codon:yes gene_type:complete